MREWTRDGDARRHQGGRWHADRRPLRPFRRNRDLQELRAERSLRAGRSTHRLVTPDALALWQRSILGAIALGQLASADAYLARPCRVRSRQAGTSVIGAGSANAFAGRHRLARAASSAA